MSDTPFGRSHEEIKRGLRSGETGLVRPESANARTFLTQRAAEVEESVEKVINLGYKSVVEALYLTIRDSEHTGLQKLERKLKAYLDNGFDDAITIDVDPEDDSVRVSY